MRNMNSINMKELDNVVGGTRLENLKMVFYLQIMTDDIFYINDPENDIIDYEKMIGFFKSKGYKFTPGKDDTTMNLFEKDGLAYGQDYIEYLMKNGEF